MTTKPLPAGPSVDSLFPLPAACCPSRPPTQKLRGCFHSNGLWVERLHLSTWTLAGVSYSLLSSVLAFLTVASILINAVTTYLAGNLEIYFLSLTVYIQYWPRADNRSNLSSSHLG